MKSTNKITILNMLSSILLKGIAFFTTPIFTRMLGTKQYGLFSVFQFRLDILVCIFGLGIVSSLGTSMYEYEDEYYKYRSSSLLLTTLSSFVFIGLFNILLHPMEKILGYESYMVECLLFLSLFYVVINYGQTAFIYEKKPVHNFIMSLVLSIVSVIISFILVLRIHGDNKYHGMVFGQFIPYCLVAVLIWVFLYSKKPALINKEYAIYGLTYGIPVVFHLLSHNVLSQSDREMMIRMGISGNEIGIYSLYCALSNVLVVILNALSNSWVPFYYEDIKNENWDDLNNKCKNIMEFFTVLFIGFILLSREVSLFFADKDFWGGINIIPFISISAFFIFLYQFPVSYEFYYKKIRVVAVATAICALVNICLNFFMIPQYGMYGAATSTAISYFVLFLIHYLFVMRMSDGSYHLKVLFIIPWFLLAVVSLAGFYLLSDIVIVRWGIAFFVGLIELYRIIKRKSVF